MRGSKRDGALLLLFLVCNSLSYFPTEPTRRLRPLLRLQERATADNKAHKNVALRRPSHKGRNSVEAYFKMSDVEEEESPVRTTTRMQRLRDELEKEQQAREALTEHAQRLESQLQNLQQGTATTDSESQERGEQEDPPKEGSLINPPDALADERDNQIHLAAPPLNEEGLQSLTKMYQAMGESQRLQGVALSKPKTFSGMEVIEDPYSLSHWYREVACWVHGYAKDPTQQVVLALQTLTGTARILVDNIIMSDPGRVLDLMSLFTLLKETFQRRDPGPDAWNEFQRARLRTSKENIISYLNRLMLLSFVINMSEDPTCPKVNEGDTATKLRIGIPYDISNKMEQHMQLMVDLGKQPDVSPWGIAVAALKIEAQEREKSRRTARTSRFTEHKNPSRPTVSTIHAMPLQGKYPNQPITHGNRVAKRFRDLSPELQKRIVTLQTELQDLPLGAPLTEDQQAQCRSNALCIRCRRYGHEAQKCTHSAPMKPKN